MEYLNFDLSIENKQNNCYKVKVEPPWAVKECGEIIFSDSVREILERLEESFCDDEKRVSPKKTAASIQPPIATKTEYQVDLRADSIVSHEVTLITDPNNKKELIMSEPTLEEVKLKEYRQHRRLQSLRQQLYSQPDPEKASDLTKALREEEDKLREVQQHRLAQKAGDGPVNPVLISSDPATKPAGIMLGKDTTGIEAGVLLRMAVVPTGVAHLLDVKETPLVSFKIHNYRDQPIRVRLTSYVEGFSATCVNTLELPRSKGDTVDQLPTFFPDRLAHVNEMTRASLNIKIDDLDAKTERHSTFPIWLMARTSAFNSLYDPSKNEWKDISYYYGAWVTPNAPEIMQLLRRAVDKHPEKSFAGYQVDEAGVKAQVKAIYEALQDEKIMYVHSVVNFGASDEQGMQRVRLPRESLLNRSANCIDGTVLMASLLEAASINPAFVFVPGHAFLAWETQEGNNEWDYLETTMISTHSFEAANGEGRRQAKAQQTAFAETKDINDYLTYSLAELRAIRGIYPME